MRKANILLLSFLLAALAGGPLRAEDTNRMMERGLKYYEKGDYDRALKDFLRVLELEPNHATAREMQMMATQKKMQKELGKEKADIVEKEVAVEKQIQQIRANEPAPVAKDIFDYPTTPSEEGELTGLDKVPTTPSQAQDIVKQRESVAENLRRRHLGTDNIVQLEEKRGQMVVTLFMNRLFLPYSDVLRDDGLVVLEHVVTQLRNNPKRQVILKAVDASSPLSQKSMPTLAARRCNVVFSHLIYSTYRPEEKNLLVKPN